MTKTKTFVCFSLAVCGVFVSFFKPGNSISCYQCNSHTNKTCADKLPPEGFKKNCEGIQKACRKIEQTIDFEVNGLPPDKRIIRSCAYQLDNLNKCYQRSGFGGRQEVCACDTDNCNSSIRNKFNIGVLLTSTLVVCLLSSLVNL